MKHLRGFRNFLNNKKGAHFLIILLVILLSACSKSSANTITSVDLEAREDAIVSITSSEAFVFDFNVVPEYTEVSLWVEKYELGALVDEKVGYMSTETQNSGSLIIATSKSNDQSHAQEFNVGVMNEGSVGSASFSDDNQPNVEGLLKITGGFSGEKEVTDEEIVLAAITYSSNEGGSSSLTTRYYQNPKDHMDELDKYDRVYLFKAKFKK